MSKLANLIVIVCVISITTSYSLRKLTLDEVARESAKDGKSYTVGPNGEHGLYELASTRQYLDQLDFADTYDYHMVHPAKVNAPESERKAYNPSCTGDSAWKRTDIFVPFPRDLLKNEASIEQSWFCSNSIPNLDYSPSV